jgi:hypothetical protein
MQTPHNLYGGSKNTIDTEFFPIWCTAHLNQGGQYCVIYVHNSLYNSLFILYELVMHTLTYILVVLYLNE